MQSSAEFPPHVQVTSPAVVVHAGRPLRRADPARQEFAESDTGDHGLICRHFGHSCSRNVLRSRRTVRSPGGVPCQGAHECDLGVKRECLRNVSFDRGSPPV